MTTTRTHPRSLRRHPKERWDTNAEFVFLRPARVGPPENPIVPAGTKVTAELRARVGERLFRSWWDSKLIGRADPYKKGPQPQSDLAIRLREKQRRRRLAREALTATSAPVVEADPIPDDADFDHEE